MNHRLSLMCIVMIGVTLEAAAQESAGAVHVAAGVSVPHQSALEANSPPPFAAPGGTTVGWQAGGGVFLSPRVSIEVDASRTGVMRASQAGRHDTSEVSTRRETFVAFGVKAHLPTAVHLEPVAGMVLAGHEGTFSSFSGDFRGFFPRVWNGGLVFGADVRIGGGRLALVPGFRMVFTGVPSGERCIIGFSGQPLCIEEEPWQWHYPRWTQWPSVTLRVSF